MKFGDGYLTTLLLLRTHLENSEFYSLVVACFLEADWGENTNFSGGIGEFYKRSFAKITE